MDWEHRTFYFCHTIPISYILSLLSTSGNIQEYMYILQKMFILLILWNSGIRSCHCITYICCSFKRTVFKDRFCNRTKGWNLWTNVKINSTAVQQRYKTGASMYLSIQMFLKLYIIMCRSDYRQCLDWILDLLTILTQLIITLNYSAIANFHTLQITRAHTKSFPARSVFTNSCNVCITGGP
jgi:hypothetical protein